MRDALLLVFKLVESTLNNTVYDEVIKDPLVYQIARENGFSGMVFKSLVKEKVDLTIYLDFQRDYYQYIERDTLQLQIIEELNQIFNQEHFKHIFLKGSFLKSIYPDSYMRSMGDIDVLVEEGKMTDIHAFLKAHDYQLHSEGSTHDVFVKNSKINIEVHPAIDKHFDERSLGVFKSVWDKVLLIDDYNYQFLPELQLIYLMSHLVKHLKSSGIGLRQVLDIGLYYQRVDKIINHESFNQMLETTQLQRFLSVILWLNQRWFNLVFIQPISNEEFDDNFYQEITEFFSQSGIHGKGKEFNRTLPNLINQSLGKKGSKGSKIRYLFKVAFPKIEDMKGSKKYLNRYPILLPYAWLTRILYLIFRKGKRTKTKLKNMSVSNEIIDKNAQLYKKMGL